MLWTLLNESGLKAVHFTSMLSLKINDQGKAVSTPIERGSFANYNKVQSPTEINVSLGIQGASFVLSLALETLKELQRGTELVSLITPSDYYDSLTLEAHSYEQDNEKGFLTVFLTLREIRQVGAQVGNFGFGFGNVLNPTSGDTLNIGKAQCLALGSEVLKRIGPTW